MKELTLDLAVQEASRCLLCYDAPCSQACPADLDPASIVCSLRFGNIAGAEEKCSEANLLEGICSEVCSQNKYCEKACIRGKLDKAIAIEKLQQFLLDYKSQDLKEGGG